MAAAEACFAPNPIKDRKSCGHGAKNCPQPHNRTPRSAPTIQPHKCG